jgi:hypothetical protein
LNIFNAVCHKMDNYIKKVKRLWRKKLKKLIETNVRLTQTHIMAIAKLDANSRDSKHLFSRPTPT